MTLEERMKQGALSSNAAFLQHGLQALADRVDTWHRERGPHGRVTPRHVECVTDSDWRLLPVQPGADAGDAFYCAPELISGNIPTTAGDIYSLAVLVQQLLNITRDDRSTETAFNGVHLIGAQRVFDRALHPDPTKRFSCAGEFAMHLALALKDLNSVDMPSKMDIEQVNTEQAPKLGSREHATGVMGLNARIQSDSLSRYLSMRRREKISYASSLPGSLWEAVPSTAQAPDPSGSSTFIKTQVYAVASNYPQSNGFLEENRQIDERVTLATAPVDVLDKDSDDIEIANRRSWTGSRLHLPPRFRSLAEYSAGQAKNRAAAVAKPLEQWLPRKSIAIVLIVVVAAILAIVALALARRAQNTRKTDGGSAHSEKIAKQNTPPIPAPIAQRPAIHKSQPTTKHQLPVIKQPSHQPAVRHHRSRSKKLLPRRAPNIALPREKKQRKSSSSLPDGKSWSLTVKKGISKTKTNFRRARAKIRRVVGRATRFSKP